MRLYDPAIGRFLARDMLRQAVALGRVTPSELMKQGIDLAHPYRYALNNPLRYVDPRGQQGTGIWNDPYRYDDPDDLPEECIVATREKEGDYAATPKGAKRWETPRVNTPSYKKWAVAGAAKSGKKPTADDAEEIALEALRKMVEDFASKHGGSLGLAVASGFATVFKLSAAPADMEWLMAKRVGAQEWQKWMCVCAPAGGGTRWQLAGTFEYFIWEVTDWIPLERQWGFGPGDIYIYAEQQNAITKFGNKGLLKPLGKPRYVYRR